MSITLSYFTWWCFSFIYNIFICKLCNGAFYSEDKHKIYAVDKYWFLLQERDLWFLITPLSVVQREDYSDIEKRRTNYTKIMVDLDKKHLYEQPKIENMMNIVKPGSGGNLKKFAFV
jgi:hypothetical protein